MDLWGDEEALGRVGSSLVGLLDDQGAAYLDLVEAGVEGDALERAGFMTAAASRHLVLPSYFDPFERRTVPLTYAFKAPEHAPPVRLFRGDSDQDRPNRIPGLAAA